jgi:hypothetical protein
MGSDLDDFYGMFILSSNNEIYEIFSEFEGINLEIIK